MYQWRRAASQFVANGMHVIHVWCSSIVYSIFNLGRFEIGSMVVIYNYNILVYIY